MMLVAEGYIPTSSHGPEPEMTSHETACLLNVSDRDAHVEITVFFSDKEPVGPYHVTIPACIPWDHGWAECFTIHSSTHPLQFSLEFC